MQSGTLKQRILAALLSLSMIITVVGGGIIGKVSGTEESGAGDPAAPIAHYTFDGADRLADSSGNGFEAEIVNRISADDIISEYGINHYLDLTGSDAYLSLPGEILNGLEEFTVEMRVYANSTSTSWAFFAAPNAEWPVWNNEHHLSVHLSGDKINVRRFANNGSRPADAIADLSANAWHTVKIVFGKDSTSVSVDNNAPVTAASQYSLADCISEGGDYSNTVLWFGHASWNGGEGLNGCIDDIRISDGSGNVLARFDFEGNGDGRFADKSGNNNGLTIVDNSSSADDIISYDDAPGNCLDLNGRDIYLSLPGSLLAGQSKATIEMKVLTADTDANWAFFAAPNDKAQAYAHENYLGVLLNGGTTVERYANNGARPGSITAGWTADEWHNIKIVFDSNKTYLYIDGEFAAEQESRYSLEDCISDDGDYSNSVLWFGHAAWGDGEGFNGCIDDIRISGDNDTLLAYFDFEGDDKLADKSGSGLQAVPEKLDCIVTDSSNGYLDLTAYGLGTSGANAYLSVSNDILSKIDKEMTVELRVRNSGKGSNWAFYAAPDAEKPEGGYENYLGILLNGGIRVERYANEGVRPDCAEYSIWSTDVWHTLRVVFAENSTRLYIDGNIYREVASEYSLKDCMGNNGVFWFGHSAWGEGFDGWIDDIKIWNYANDIPDETVPEDIEKAHIITDHVVNPANTTVNMFDYWFTENQTDNDYRRDDVTSITNHIMTKGINKDHPFLFIGYDASAYAYGNGLPLEPAVPRGGSVVSSYINNPDDVGKWNVSGHITGIVENRLVNGYPKLSGLLWEQPGVYGTYESLKTAYDNATESLAYLFNPEVDQLGKASYTDVTGLFRLNGDGYYYFDADTTFAELNIQDTDGAKQNYSDEDGGNHITLYDTKWMPLDPNNGNALRGQFFPFNDWSDLFHVDENGNIDQNHDYIYYQNMPGREQINHYFGMTIETQFKQPVNGRIHHGQDDMRFEFSGDDDVWIFVDDVLVCDIGGMHGRITAEINFATGKVTVNGKTDTLKAIFDAAGEDTSDFNGDTFGNQTSHTLSFFYLERGNNISNASINFNFQDTQPDVIQKVDEDGSGLGGAVFELYGANEVNGTYQTAELITTVTTRDDGSAEFVDADGNAILFSQKPYTYYILREITPAGYRSNPDIILKYDKGATNTFTVVNKTETGAYASFTAYFTQTLEEGINSVGTDKFDDKGVLSSGDRSVSDPELQTGLAFVVPTMRDDKGNWVPLYGSNAEGWKTADLTKGYMNALLEAVFGQMSSDGYYDMYMAYDSATNTLLATLKDVPGNAARYTGNNDSGDLSQATLFMPKAVLEALGLYANGKTYADDDELYDALKKAVRTLGVQNAMDTALEADGNLPDTETGLVLLHTSEFERTYSTILHIINIRQKLYVHKINKNGENLSGAVFGLYKTAEEAVKGENCLISGTTVADGMLTLNLSEVKIRNANGELVNAKLDNGQYWLREISAPQGYLPNNNLIEVIVDDIGVFVNATAYAYTYQGGELKLTPIKVVDENSVKDSVKVYAAAGTIAENLTRFTAGNDVLGEIDLSVIKGEKYSAEDSSDGKLAWVSTGSSFSGLKYYGSKLNNAKGLLDYAASAGASTLAALGIMEAENGFAYVKPMSVDGTTDLSAMFSLLNVVEVTDFTGEIHKTETTPGEDKPVMPGDTIDYEITWKNYSSETATLTITDELDSNVDLVSAEYGGVKLKGNGTETNESGTITIKYARGIVTWTIENVQPNQDVKLLLTVVVKDNILDGDMIINKAVGVNNKIVDAATGEPIPYETEEVENPTVDLNITKEQSANNGQRTTERLTVKEGDLVTYYLTVTVTGTKGQVLQNVVVRDTVPEGLEFVEGSVTCIKPDSDETVYYKVDEPTPANGNTIYWHLRDREVGEVLELSYTVKVPYVDESTAWTNIAQIASDGPKDPPENPDNPENPDDPDDYEYPDIPDDPDDWEDSNEVEIYDPVGSLEISKIVKATLDNYVDSDRAFEFTAEFKPPLDENGNEPTGAYSYSYSYTYYKDGKELKSGTGAFTNAANKGIFELSDGQSVLIKGLPAGTRYTVTETGTDGYTGAGSNTSGTIQDGKGENGTDKITSHVQFVNTYNPDGILELTVRKFIDGRHWRGENDKFTFILTPDDDTAAAIEGDKITMPSAPDSFGRYFAETTDESGEAAFGDIRFNAPGSYVFYVSEDKPGNTGDLIYDETTYTVNVTVADNKKNGKLDVEAVYAVNSPNADDEGSIIFTNQAHITTDIPVTKEIANRGWLPGDSFTFTISTTDDNVVFNSDRTVTISYGDTSKTKLFKNIEFFSTGTYTFTIKETPPEGDSNGLTYDYEHTVKVVVGENSTNGLVIEAVKDGSKTVTNSKTGVVFTNTYNVSPVTADFTLNVSKTLSGRDWIKDFDKFTFQLAAYDKRTQDAIANGDITIDGDSVVISSKGQTPAFGDITFYTVGEFRFSVTELGSSSGGIEYDKSVYVVTVTVTDDKTGHLEIESVTVTKLDGGTVTASGSTYTLNFENKYNAIGSWPPVITKEISCRPWSAEDKFEFVLELIDTPEGVDASTVTMPASITVKGAAGGKDAVIGKFNEVRFTKPGVYTFKLSEKQPDESYKGDLIFDRGWYELTVSVADNGSGTLVPLLIGAARFEGADDTEGTAYSDEAYLFTNISGARISIPIEKLLEGRAWLDTDKFTFSIAPYGDETVKALEEGLIAFDAEQITIGSATDETGGHTASFGVIGYKAANVEEAVYTFAITESGEGLPENVSQDYTVYIVTVKFTDNNGTLTAQIIGAGTLGSTVTAIEPVPQVLRFVNTYEPEPEPAPEPPETDDRFNLDDDGPPRGNQNLPTDDDNRFNLDDDGIPRGDQNLPTGVSLGGSAYVAVGALLVSAAAVVVRKRRNGKKDK